jgi:hypothetical protein
MRWNKSKKNNELSPSPPTILYILKVNHNHDMLKVNHNHDILKVNHNLDMIDMSSRNHRKVAYEDVYPSQHVAGTSTVRTMI